MATIYLTYRASDTTQDELQIIVEQLEKFFGQDHITVTEADSHANIFELYNLVQTHDALLVLIGQRFMTFVDDYDRPLLDSAYDYLYNEILAALEKDEMWISTILTDYAEMPHADVFPDNLREITHRDSITLYNLQTIEQDIQKLAKRLGILGIDREKQLVKKSTHENIEQLESGMNSIGMMFYLIIMALLGLCAFSTYLYEECFSVTLSLMAC